MLPISTRPASPLRRCSMRQCHTPDATEITIEPIQADAIQ
ncbi:hypothetical protein IMCC9480_1163 [Oxalobacteraceae bacterium IMCC9480]|nr:hypothetical protein IMCC9480_1163 [Oxalobacteraceae bacterium IMCC9480]